eukprot:jgi/Bigna1/88751/estExt_fgenesh1_pg.C_370105
MAATQCHVYTQASRSRLAAAIIAGLAAFVLLSVGLNTNTSASPLGAGMWKMGARSATTGLGNGGMVGMAQLSRGNQAPSEGRPVQASALVDVDDSNFKEIVERSAIPVLVDFWAPWCGPCRLIEPLIEEISNEYDGRMLTVKVNTDESPETATKLGIRSIPSLMIFKDGARKETIVGAVPKNTITSALDKLL